MAMDPRHALGAVLTFTMFALLGNMIKKDHFDAVQVALPDVSVKFDANKITEESLVSLPRLSKGPWKEDMEELKLCGTRRQLKSQQSKKNFIILSLSYGPEYHLSQIANAVVVARSLGATLVLPDIIGANPGEIRTFQEVYDIEKFIKNLHGVVDIVKPKHAELPKGKPSLVKVPHRVTQDHITQHVEPLLETKGHLRLVTYFPSINMRKTEENEDDVDSTACLAMYGTLELQPEVHELVDSVVERLRTLSRKSYGQFIAVDLRLEMLGKKGCQTNGANQRKSCYTPQEIAVFLRNIGFDQDTTIYLTQSRWHSSLDALKNFFPKTYTKESVMPEDKKGKFLNAGSADFEKILDFYVCSQSDVFVPAISGLFYANVAGKRIASGRTQILVPGKIKSSSKLEDFISPYVSKKNHLAYSCFC
ncbi:hypothetical protein ACHQM5_030503 [Ranunculus cassubicifolius]